MKNRMRNPQNQGCGVPNCPGNEPIYDWSWYVHPDPVRPPRRGIPTKSVWSHFRWLMARSSISGINRIFSAKNWGTRIIWMVVCLFCIIGFGYQTLRFAFIYNRKPSAVQIYVENDGTAEFPSVTLCNNNRFKKTIFCSKYPDWCSKFYGNVTITEAEMNDIMYSKLENGQGHTIRELGHRRNAILSCAFSGIPKMSEKVCIENLEYIYDPDLGNCYVIPSKLKDGTVLEASEADFWHEAIDLSILMDVEINESMETKRDKGIRVTIHDDSFVADVHSDSLTLGPGFSYSLNVQKVSVRLLPLPYRTNCTNYRTLPWQKNKPKHLTSRMCTVGCSQYHQMKKCSFVTKNLSLFYVELPFEPMAVRDEQRECAKEEEINTMDYCRRLCSVPCYDVYFEVSESNTELDEVEIAEFSMKGFEQKSWDEKKKTLLFIRISYGSLEHKIYKHEPKYDTLELFSYLGGYSGVWLGFSLLTVYEMIEILCSTSKYAVQKLQRHLQNRRISRAIVDSKRISKNSRGYRKKFYG